MLLNLCQAIEPHEPHVTLVEYEMPLVYFHYLDKNSRWVTDCNGNDDFLRITRLGVNQLMSLCYGASVRELSLYFHYIYVKTISYYS